MFSDIYWIEKFDQFPLATMARPRAGDWLEGEIANWARAGLKTVISLLEPHEITDLGLEREEELCESNGIAFLSFPIPDRGLPSNADQIDQMISGVVDLEQPTAIHCRAGIGRSSLIAAEVMAKAGFDPASVFDAISQARGVTVPDTEGQREWFINRYSSN